ncbi:MAG: small ribosomal subunit Rsm22 family protein [Myxococcota bacterium]
MSGELRGLLQAGAWPEALALYESAVLDVLGVSPSSAPVSRWARAYEALSKQLTEDRTEALAEASSAELSGEDGLAVAALVFGARTLFIAGHLFRAQPPPPGMLLDLGSGWGAAGLAGSAFREGPVRLLDVDARVLERARALFSWFGLQAETEVGRMRSSGAPASIVSAYAVNEVALQGEDVARMTAAWLDALPERGRLYLIEPGTHRGSQTLSMIRDGFASGARILGPCTHAAPCPLRVGPNWCHFSLPLPLGPIAAGIAHAAHRQHHVVRFSWLALERSPPVAGSDASRVLSVRRLKGKRRIEVCGVNGADAWILLERGALPGIESGDRWRLVVGGSRRGDGLRVEPQALERETSLGDPNR